VPKHLSALATRAAVVTASAAAATLVGVLPATAAAAPATAGTQAVTPVAKAAPAPALLAPVKTARASAVQNALAKLGTPYRYGADGPNAFDCSGLVQWAFEQEGISLPRTSRAQSRAGTPVSRDELRPGDLVFFYKPVSHVGIYIGDGKIVHASNRSDPVKVSDMDGMRYNSARRV